MLKTQYSMSILPNIKAKIKYKRKRENMAKKKPIDYAELEKTLDEELGWSSISNDEKSAYNRFWDSAFDTPLDIQSPPCVDFVRTNVNPDIYAPPTFTEAHKTDKVYAPLFSKELMATYDADWNINSNFVSKIMQLIKCYSVFRKKIPAYVTALLNNVEKIYVTTKNMLQTFTITWNLNGQLKRDAKLICNRIKRYNPRANYLIFTFCKENINIYAAECHNDFETNITDKLEQHKSDRDVKNWVETIAICASHWVYRRDMNSMSDACSTRLMKMLKRHIDNNAEYVLNPAYMLMNWQDYESTKGAMDAMSNITEERLLMSIDADLCNLTFLFDGKTAIKTEKLAMKILKQGFMLESSCQEMYSSLARALSLCFIKPDNTLPNKNADPVSSPSEIFDYITTNVVSQDDAAKAAAMLCYHHANGHSRNMIMIGPTGCGKTEIWRTLSEKYPNIIIANGPMLTGEGWKGDYKLSTLFYEANSRHITNPIIVIDEFDKMLEPVSSSHDLGSIIQNELLKIMDGREGATITITADKKPPITFNSSDISVVLCGSFSRMVAIKEKHSSIGFGGSCKIGSNEPYKDYTIDDLIKYAYIRDEIAGRINNIVVLHKMTNSDFENILRHETASPVRQLEKQMGVKISINDSTVSQLANMAVETKLGCRPIKTILQKRLDDQIYDNPTQTSFDLSNVP